MFQAVQSNRSSVLTMAALMLLAISGCAREEAANSSASDSMVDKATAQPPASAGGQAGEAESMPMPMPAGQGDAMPQTAGTHEATGKISGIDHNAGTVRIAHGRVASIGLPAMTMDFRVQSHEMLGALEEGQQVRFTFTQEAGGQYRITQIAPAGEAEAGEAERR